MLEWRDDLKVLGSGLYLDARAPRPMSFISHAHADHIAAHDLAIATPATAEFLAHRLPEIVPAIRRVEYRTDIPLNGDGDEDGHAHVRLLPAGHVPGSAMIRVQRDDGESLLYTGDFKLRRCLTVECAEPEPADHLVMESTYGLPMFRFPPRDVVAQELVTRCADALRDGRQPIVLGYSLGKAQEITRVLTDAGLNVTQHGAAFAMTEVYQRLGLRVGAVRRYRYEDFHGRDAIDLRERGVLVAPPHVARSGFVTRFDRPLRIVCTGWAMLRGAQYRYGVDHAIPMSDHADFAELLELIDRVRPRKIYTHHGYPEFVDHLRARGLDATLARPDAQLSLFE